MSHGKCFFLGFPPQPGLPPSSNQTNSSVLLVSGNTSSMSSAPHVCFLLQCVVLGIPSTGWYVVLMHFPLLSGCFLYFCFSPLAASQSIKQCGCTTHYIFASYQKHNLIAEMCILKSPFMHTTFFRLLLHLAVLEILEWTDFSTVGVKGAHSLSAAMTLVSWFGVHSDAIWWLRCHHFILG